MPIPAPAHASKRFEGEIVTAWTWQQEMFDGSMHEFECITRPDTATVIPFVDADTVLLTHQVQPGREPFMDFPGGRVDSGENAEAAARRELEEETGKRAANVLTWHHIQHRGLIRYEEFFFLASGLTDGTRHLDAGEKIEIVPTPWEDVVRLCLQRKLRQSNAMLAVLQMTYDPESRERFEAFRKSLRIA